MKPDTPYKILHMSEWVGANGNAGTSWTQVGTAFLSKDGMGMTLYIREGLSVTGKLVIKEDDEYPAARRQQPGRRRDPPVQQRQPPLDNGFEIPDDDIPF